MAENIQKSPPPSKGDLEGDKYLERYDYANSKIGCVRFKHKIKLVTERLY